MTAFTKSLSMILPSGDDDPRDGHSDIADTRKWVQERENVDHYWPDSGDTVDAAQAGEHRKVQFYGVLAEDPTLGAGESAIYIKTVSAVSELFWKDSAGTVKQITSGGKLNVAALEAVLLTGDQTIGGVKTFSAPPASATAPTTDSQVANKKYVDDAIAAIDYSAYTLVPGTRVTVDTLGATLLPTTVYKAAGPGMLIAEAVLSAGEYLRVLVDATSNPSTVWGRAEPGMVLLAGDSTFSVTVPIPKDMYVKMSSDGSTRTLAWIPFGSAGLVKQ